MPVAVAIQTGGLSTFLTFGNWGKSLYSHRLAPVFSPDPAPVARIIDIAPRAETPVASIADKRVLAYGRPERPGLAPRLWMAAQPTGQTIDLTV